MAAVIVMTQKSFFLIEYSTSVKISNQKSQILDFGWYMTITPAAGIPWLTRALSFTVN